MLLIPVLQWAGANMAFMNQLAWHQSTDIWLNIKYWIFFCGGWVLSHSLLSVVCAFLVTYAFSGRINAILIGGGAMSGAAGQHRWDD